MNNTFIWTDLSTFNIEVAKQFYSSCFNWHYEELSEGYVLCNTDKNSAAGLYTMPEQFQNIGMPSFWMPYIQVNDIHQVVQTAEAHGAKIEIKPQAAPGGGLIALIRDPAGAGFTCYEGNGFANKSKANKLGHMVWNELHVSDMSKVEPFYTNVFGWNIKATKNADRYDIYSPAGDSQLIAGIQVTSNEIKGDKEYWGVYFCVEDLAIASECVTKHGGEIVAEQPLGNRPAVLAYDSQGAAFYIVAAEKDSSELDKTSPKKSPNLKWRALLGLALVAAAVLAEVNWLWGLLFLLWVIPDIKSGSTHFLEHVERRKNPIIYWCIIATWTALSLYLLLE